MSDEWPKDWPKKCPPEDAQDAQGIFYRNVQESTPSDWDMKTHKERGACDKVVGKKFKKCECNHCSLSVYNTPEGVRFSRIKYPGIGDFVAVATLAPEHGKVKITNAQGHCEFWPKPGVNRKSLFSKTYSWKP